jgi:hypothetical protein
MLYVGHFSFMDESSEESESYHGAFTCLVEASDVDDALVRLRDCVQRIHDESDALEAVDAVFLDSCIEVHRVPKSGMLTRVELWTMRSSMLGSISTELIGVNEADAVAYVDEAEATSEDEEEFETTPFLEF